MCERVEALGAFCRFESALPDRLRELIVLIAARHFDAQYSWNAHADKAVAAGISAASIQQLAERREPDFGDPEAQITYRFATEVLEKHFVSDETFAVGMEAFGEQRLVDLIGSLGNYSMLAMLLNTFEVDLQPDRPAPFPDVRGFERVKPRPAASA